MKRIIYILTLLLTVSPVLADDHDHGHEAEHHHFDISPYLVDGQLLAGGLTHDGDTFAPPITVFGYAFGEDAADPYNPADPGVNQLAGVGNLPVGAALSYDILSSLLYWDGSGEPAFGDPGDALIVLGIGSSANDRTLTGTSGPQAGAFIQSVAQGVTDGVELGGGVVHKHFTTELYATAGASNVPDIGDPSYVEPPAGMYAFQIGLALVDGSETYRSEPLWVVFNNGLDEHAHEEAMAYLVPEPASIFLLAGAGGWLVARRRR